MYPLLSFPLSTITIEDNVDEQSISNAYDEIDEVDDDLLEDDDDDEGVEGNGIDFNDDIIRSI